MQQKNKWFQDNINPDIADAIVRLNVILPKRAGTVTRDFRPDVEIDYESLETQMIEMPSIFAFWSAILSEQRAVVARVERAIISKRSAIAIETLEKITDIPRWKLEELVEADSDIQDLENKLLSVKKNESKLYDIVNSLRMKSDHIRSLAGFKRQEYSDAK